MPMKQTKFSIILEKVPLFWNKFPGNTILNVNEVQMYDKTSDNHG